MNIDFLDLLQYLFNTLLPMLLLFIIINGAFRHFVFRKRIFANIISGAVLFVLFSGAVLIDYFLYDVLYIYYAMFAVSSIIMASVSVLILHVIAKKKNMSTSMKKRKFHRQEFLYIVFEYQGDIILQRTQKGVSGLLVQLKHELFHDVALEQLFHMLAVDLYKEHVKYVGKASLGGKIEQVFHCYYIQVDQISQKFINHVSVDKREVINLSMIEFDKQLILRTIMKEDFDIVL